MSGAVDVRINTASVAQIADHLAKADDAFIPRLSDRVDIMEYAQKIADRAERFEAWSGGDLVGLVAAYSNDTTTRIAHITSVSVLSEYRRQGIAARLIDASVEFAKGRHFPRISLEVDRENLPAVELYEARGFTVVGVNGRTVEMLLDTREESGMDSRS